MYNLTVFQPAYRVDKWEAYIYSIYESIGIFGDVEVVFCGPNKPNFALPKNVKFLLDYGSPARCANIAASASTSPTILLGSDDALFVPQVLGEALEFYNSLDRMEATSFNPKDVVVPIRYGEANTWMPPEYWLMHHHPTLRLGGIDPKTVFILNCIIDKQYFLNMGGYDAVAFNTCNFGGHDIAVRLHNDGARIVPFEKHIMMCEWSPATKDHSPMEVSEKIDYEVFKGLYSNTTKRARIPFNMYKGIDDVWQYASLRN